MARSIKAKTDLFMFTHPPRYVSIFDRKKDNLLSQIEHDDTVQLDSLRREWADVSGDQAGVTTGTGIIAELIEKYGRPTDPYIKAVTSQKQKPASSFGSPSSPPAINGPVSYRSLTFHVGGEYSLVYDDKKIVRGIWYHDSSSIRNASRNRMVVATAEVNGFIVLDSDYETTIVGGIGGVEDLQNSGGSILWFDSTRDIFGR